MLSANVIEHFARRGWELEPVTSGARAGSDGAAISVSLDGPLEAHIDLQRRQVALHDPENLPGATLDHFAIDLLLPRLLAHDGRLVLHAGVVAGPFGAIGFLGPSGSGKSTLGAKFLRRGGELLSDDGVVLEVSDGRFIAEPIYPSLRLFPDTIARVLQMPAPAQRVAHYTEKRRLDLAGGLDSAPVAALFVLGAADPDGAITIRRLAPAAACVALVANGFSLRPEDRDEARRKFELAAEAARALPVFSLAYPRDFSSLDGVVASVLETLAAGPVAEQGPTD